MCCRTRAGAFRRLVIFGPASGRGLGGVGGWGRPKKSFSDRARSRRTGSARPPRPPDAPRRRAGGLGVGRSRRPPPASAAALPPVGGWQLVGGRRRGKAGWRAADQPLWPTARGRGRRPTPARPRAAARDAPSQAAGPPSRAAQQPRPSRLVSWLLCAVVSSSRAAGSVMTPAERRRGGGLSCCARRDGARGAHTGGRAAAARQVANAACEGMHAAETSLPTGRHAPGSSSRSAPAATRPTLGAPSAQCGREWTQLRGFSRKLRE